MQGVFVRRPFFFRQAISVGIAPWAQGPGCWSTFRVSFSMKQRTKRSGSSSVVSLALTGGIVLFGAGAAAYVLMGDEGAKPAVEHVLSARDVVRNVSTAGPASAVKPTVPAASTPAVTPPTPIASAPVVASAPVAPVSGPSLPVVASAPAVAPQLVSVASGPQVTPQPAVPASAVPQPAQPVAAVAHPQPVPVAVSAVAATAPPGAVAPAVAIVTPVATQSVAAPTAQPKPAVPAPQAVAPVAHVAAHAAGQAPEAVATVVPARPVQKKPKRAKHLERQAVPEPSPEQAQTLAPPKAELLPEAAAAAAAAIAQREKLRQPAAAAPGAVTPAPVAVTPIATERPSARPIDDRSRKVEAARAAQVTDAAPSASQYREIHPVVAEPLVSDAKPSVVARSSGGDKAWVRLGSTRTVIVTKGQSVPGLGTFEGADSKGAKFDSGYVPISQ